MTIDQPPASQRRAGNDRATVALEVTFHPQDEAPRVGRLEDLSEGGARIDSKVPCAKGEVILVHLPWPSRDEPTVVTAFVRWSELSRMGLQFTLGGPAQSLAVSKLRNSQPAHTEALAYADEATDSEDCFARDALLASEKHLPGVVRRIRQQEIDASGTLHYSRLFELFDDVYVDLLERGGVNVPRALANRGWFANIVHAEAEYLAPIRFGDTVVAHVVKVRFGKSTATIGYRLASEDGRPLAVGHTEHVFVDGTTYRPCPIPEAVLRALTAERIASLSSA